MEERGGRAVTVGKVFVTVNVGQVVRKERKEGGGVRTVTVGQVVHKVARIPPPNVIRVPSCVTPCDQRRIIEKQRFPHGAVRGGRWSLELSRSAPLD